MLVSVRDYGAVGDGLTDDTTAILAAQAAVGNQPLYLPAGVYPCSATLTAQTIIGESRQQSVLLYTGTGAAISVVDPTVRSHNKRITDLAIVTPTAGDVALDGVPGAGTPVASTIGVDLASHSRAHVSNVLVAGFEVGVRIGGSLNSLYNTLVDTVAGACGTGFLVADYLANENRFLACRANVCATGFRVVGGDRNVIAYCAIESGGEGVRIAGADADGTVVSSCRFENNDKDLPSIYVGSEVPDVTVADNQVYPSSGPLDIRAQRRTVRDSRRPLVESVTDRSDVSWRFERNATFGNATAALVIADTRTDAGNPTTLELVQGRWSGHFVRGTRPDGTEIFRINGDGVIKARATGSLPSASAAGAGGMAYHTGTRRPVWSDGTTWRYADGTAV